MDFDFTEEQRLLDESVRRLVQDAYGFDYRDKARVRVWRRPGRVVDRAVQVMGRFGLVRGSAIERLYREARPMRIYEGSTEVILDSLARQLVRRHCGGQGTQA